MKGNSERSTMARGIAIGILSSVVLTVIGAFLTAWLLHAQQLQESAVGYAVMFIIIASTVVGSVVAAAIYKEKRLITCLAAAAGYFILLLAGTALLFDGQYQGVAVTALLILAGSLCVVLVGSKPKQSKAAVRFKMRNR